MQAEWSGLAMAERNYETVPALRGDAAVWERKLDQGDHHGHDDDDDVEDDEDDEDEDDDDDDDDETEITLF